MQSILGLATVLSALLPAAALPDSGVVAEPLSVALLGDDECSGANVGDRQCALNALQRRSREAVSGEAAQGDHPFISGCMGASGGKPCPTGLRCIEKPGGGWSQCVDCSPDGFLRDCILMNQVMRGAAEATCGRTCPFTTPRPLSGGCAGESGVKCQEGLTCVEKEDGTWSQCVDCSRRRFPKDCQKLNDGLRLPAVKACRQSCLNTQCHSKDWCLKPYNCIGNSTWAQCVNCKSKKTFHYFCRHWNPDFRHIVQKQCGRKCRHPHGHHHH
mmetsp:Transcript_33697/g.76374  ORF Transcript_33697/g.76374 Transcript_33697/m.76374 type:complete len:271 (+) Transcript_33697:54-866(+)